MLPSGENVGRSTTGHALSEAIAAEPGLILVVTGAGVSLDSGIATFRGHDAGAIWRRDVRELATAQHFHANPVATWQWYRDRFGQILQARPNPAHIALAALEWWQGRRGGRLLLVTQNIDTLHEQAGSIDLVKVHGSADRVRCSRARCALGATVTLPLAGIDFGPFERDPGVATLPRCPACGALLRPHVLWFDELYTSHPDYHWPDIVAACDRMRLVVTIGTSLSVGVTDFVQTAAYMNRVPIFNVDPADPSGAADPRAVHVRARAEALLPVIYREVSRDGGQQ